MQPRPNQDSEPQDIVGLLQQYMDDVGLDIDDIYSSSLAELVAIKEKNRSLETFKTGFINQFGLNPEMGPSEKRHIFRRHLQANQYLDRRIEVLKSQQAFDELRSAANNLDSGARDQIIEKIEGLEARSVAQSEQAVEDLKTQSDYETQLQRIELDEKRNAAKVSKWGAFIRLIDRDTIAIFVGAMLLLFFSIFIAIDFCYGGDNKIFESAFLVILGYFFGTGSAARRQDPAKPATPVG